MGRKGKKGDFLDLEDPEALEQPPPTEEEPVNAAKPKAKKGKKGKATAAADGAYCSAVSAISHTKAPGCMLVMGGRARCRAPQMIAALFAAAVHDMSCT